MWRWLSHYSKEIKMNNYIFEPVTKKQAISMCNDNRIKHINLTIKNCTKELKDGFSV